MKLCIAFIVVAVAFVSAELKNPYTDEEKKELLEMVKTCIETTGVDPKLVEKSKDEYVETDDKNYKDFVFCIYNKSDYISDANVVNVDFITEDFTQHFGKDEATRFVDTCVKTPAATAIETAEAMNKCYYENFPEHLTIEF